MSGKLLRSCGALSALTMAFGAQAATLTFEYDLSFGAVTPDGPAPWLTAVFDDEGSAGSAKLTMTVSSNIGAGDATELYFNLNTAMSPDDLTISRTGGTGPAAGLIAIDTETDNFKADGDGKYDIYMDFDTGGDRFEAGETLEFSITGALSAAGLLAADFDFLSFPSGGNGPYLAAAHVQSTGPDPFAGSDWIAPTTSTTGGGIPPPVVPIPAAAWLFGSALALLFWRRKTT